MSKSTSRWMVFLGALLGALIPLRAQAKPQVYVDFPASYLPGTPSMHPRIYLQNRLMSLKATYNATPQAPAVAAFKRDIQKLMSYNMACQDWRCDNGWPAAALALDWLLTGNAASGQKACDIYLPHFTGDSTKNQGTDLYYALAYDWLYNHPCFTDAMKASLRSRLATWSDQTAAADEAGSWTPHDTDRNIAATAGHFIGGLAIVGEDPASGQKLLRRGWTGWKYGINSHATLPDFPVVDFFRKSLDTGIPLPGWDYGMISDVHMVQNLYYIMDELGIIDREFPDLKGWWVNALTYFMHSVDPANTHYHWIGDQQSSVLLDDGAGGYLWSTLSNCIFLAERYGRASEAAIGRSFLDGLGHPSYGISEGDTMLWFMTASADSAPRMDYKTSARRYVVGGFGPGQHMGIGMFRSDWTSSAMATDSKQVTWGGFYGIGSYIVDHMHNVAGSFWLWKNGEYLLTDPVNYGGNEAAIHPFTLWNSLSIPNEAVPNNNEQYDNGGPIVYFNQGSAYLEHGRASEADSVFYARLSADDSYDVPDNMYATCKGVCRQPVGRYTRSFYYDGISDIVFLIDRVDLVRSRPTGLRFRTQNPSTLPTLVKNDTVSIPSDKGSYRTLVRVLGPAAPQPWVIAKEPWKGTVSDWQIKQSMVGSQARMSFAAADRHRIITVLQAGKTSDGNTALDSAGPITAADSLGACAGASCFVVAAEHSAAARTTLRYETPPGLPANSRHLIADLDPAGCFAVKSSASGTIRSELAVSPSDHTLLFVAPSGGAQEITLDPVECTGSGSGSGTGSAATGCSCQVGSRGATSGAGAAAVGLSLLAAGCTLLGYRARRRRRTEALLDA